MTGMLERLQQVEYGDFQTPDALARQIVNIISQKGRIYRAAVEPTCGIGNILAAAADHLPGLEHALGIDINEAYVAYASKRQYAAPDVRVEVRQNSFFNLDFSAITMTLPQPYILIGNPPWVTNAGVGQLKYPYPALVEGIDLHPLELVNLPKKVNFAGLSGFDALTGKSNFDISEWIMLRLLENVAGTDHACAMLIKTSVARKTIAHAARMGLAVTDFEMYVIDAKKNFNVSVSACLLYFRGSHLDQAHYNFTTFADLEGGRPVQFAYEHGNFVNDLDTYQRTQKYASQRKRKGGWRSGIKHDAAKVMELRQLGRQLLTPEGKLLDIEPDLLYPFLKSSDIAKGNTLPRIFTIVTQRVIGESTDHIRLNQPLTWAYLEKHRTTFNNRKSSIYKDKPPFSIFGIGEYSFAPYKIAISGLYKKLKFTLLEPIDGKCIMVDDTCYFLGFQDRQTALIYLSALESELAHEFFESRIEWDEKRPIKKDILEGFDLELFIQANATEVGCMSSERGVSGPEFEKWLASNLGNRLLS